MLIWSKNDSLIARVIFAEDLVDDRNEKAYAVIRHCSEDIIIRSWNSVVRVVHPLSDYTLGL